jgi:cytochrome oxidase Cu insertion factor (SCO1/SenC/PrrC family)
MAAEVIMNRPWTRLLLGSLAALALVASACSRKDSKDSEQTPEKGQESAQEQDSPLLAVGADAPDFQAQAHDGTTVNLAALEGQPVVLYFYPKDATPG